MFDAFDEWALMLRMSTSRIVPFLTLMIAFMFIFGLPFGLLNFGREKDDLLQDPITNNWVVDSLLNQFLIVIAQPKMDNLAGSRARPCSAVNPEKGLDCQNLQGTEGFSGRGYDVAESYAIFFLSAFIANVIILNIGIAIIGDTYAFVFEHLDWLEKTMKLVSVTRWSPNVSRTSSKDERRFFLYHVRVVDGIMSFDDRALWAG